MGNETGQLATGNASLSGHIERLIERRDVLILYIDQCRKKQDWHGVRDAATDLEVCLAELGAYESMRRHSGCAATHTKLGLCPTTESTDILGPHGIFEVHE